MTSFECFVKKSISTQTQIIFRLPRFLRQFSNNFLFAYFVISKSGRGKRINLLPELRSIDVEIIIFSIVGRGKAVKRVRIQLKRDQIQGGEMAPKQM